MNRSLLALFLLSAASVGAAHAEDIRGRNIQLVYQGRDATINILKDGKIFIAQRNCGGGKLSAKEAVLGRTHSFAMRCGNERTNRGTSRASFTGDTLKIHIDVSFGGQSNFSEDWTISINGNSCSGELGVNHTVAGPASYTISSCRIRDGMSR